MRSIEARLRNATAERIQLAVHMHDVVVIARQRHGFQLVPFAAFGVEDFEVADVFHRAAGRQATEPGGPTQARIVFAWN